MGGAPRGRNKPRPSFEDGALRDPEIDQKQAQDFNESALRSLIKRATRAGAATASTPAD